MASTIERDSAGGAGCCVCGEARAFRCTGCRQALDCGAACQRAAWASHRDACRPEQARLKTLEAAAAPAPPPPPRLHLRGAAMHPPNPSGCVLLEVGERRDASAPKRGMRCFNVQALNELLMRRARPGEEPDMKLVDGEAFIGLWSAGGGKYELPPKGFMRAVRMKSEPD